MHYIGYMLYNLNWIASKLVVCPLKCSLFFSMRKKKKIVP